VSFEPTFVLEGLDAPTLRILLRALYRLDLRHLKRNPRTPLLYASGVRYEAEKGLERWQGIAEALRRGVADCEDLSSWRIAELAMQGERAKPAVSKRHTAQGWLWHVWVIRGDGTQEDPSRLLGMK
jgi:hypothetical protein